MKKIKINTFLKGIITLMFSQITIKLLGMIYTLYLTNKEGFGDKGNALYISSYQVYAIFLTISSIGIPNAISKLISENLSVGDIKEAQRIFKVSIAVFSILGFLCTIVLYFFSDFIAVNLLEIEACSDILKILAPSIFFVSISSVIRGYFIGLQNLKVSAVSQSLEQFLKTIFTIILIEIVSRKCNYNTEIMAKTTVIAVSCTTILGFAYNFIAYIKSRKKANINLSIIKINKSIKQILKEIFAIAIPISTVSFVITLGKNIDSITIIKLLNNIVGEESAKEKYGILSSKVETLSNFPMAINGAIAVSLVPEISKLIVKNQKKDVIKKIKYSFLITCLICIPIEVIMFIFPDKILNILYPNSVKGAELLRIAAIGIVFNGLTQDMTGIMQGVGETRNIFENYYFFNIYKAYFKFNIDSD